MREYSFNLFNFDLINPMNYRADNNDSNLEKELEEINEKQNILYCTIRNIKQNNNEEKHYNHNEIKLMRTEIEEIYDNQKKKDNGKNKNKNKEKHYIQKILNIKKNNDIKKNYKKFHCIQYYLFY